MGLITIITVNLNNVGGLRRTFESVVSQSWREFEFIVIDGGSKDGSKEFIEENTGFFSYWVSEPDKGVYTAMNKGIKQAKGEYLLFLNSGDCLSSNIVLGKIMEDLDGTDLISGKIKITSNQQPATSNQEPITFPHLFTNSLPHQSTFIRNELFKKIGLYNEHNKLTSDWQFFMLAIFKHNVSHRFIDHLICVAEDGGMSRSLGSTTLIREEKKNFMMAHPEMRNADFVRLFFDNEQELMNLKRSRIFRVFKRLLKNG